MSYKGTVIDDNMVVSFEFKMDGAQILTLCGMLVYSYYRIEMRIVELEDKFIEASDTHIEDLLAKTRTRRSTKRINSKNKLSSMRKSLTLIH